MSFRSLVVGIRIPVVVQLLTISLVGVEEESMLSNISGYCFEICMEWNPPIERPAIARDFLLLMVR